MDDKKVVSDSVEGLVEELKKNPSTRFSKSDFQMLIWGVLSDKEFKAKKYVLRNNELVEEEADLNGAMGRFLDKLLKHAGMNDSGERSRVIDTFEYNSRDVEWIADAVDEAMSIYSDCGKNVKIFRDKILQLTIKKMVRSGKYAGKVSFKKTVIDRALAAKKRNGKTDS